MFFFNIHCCPTLKKKQKNKQTAALPLVTVTILLGNFGGNCVNLGHWDKSAFYNGNDPDLLELGK